MRLQDLCALAANPALSPEQIDALLERPTSASCEFCGQENLTGYEALNRRCERCRRAYSEAASFWHDDLCTCKLAKGWRCVGGAHVDGQGNVVTFSTPEGKTTIDWCPIYRHRKRKERR